MSSLSRRAEVEKQILRFCRGNYKSLGEVSEMLDMNKNTVRSVYLYPMTKAGMLERSTELPFKSGTKYKTI